MRHFILLLLIPFCNYVFAKNPENKNSQLFTVNYSSLFFLNKPDVKTLEGSKNFLTANNTNGYVVGVGYEFSSTYRLMFSVNTFYGIQRHDLQWKFTFDYFDKDADFGDYTDFHRFNATNQYVCNLFMIGYNIPLSTKFKILPKAGIGTMHRFGERKEEQAHIIVYTQSGNTRSSQFALTDASAGAWGSGWNDRVRYYSISMNLSHGTKAAFIKEVSLGVEYNQAFVSRKSPGINNSRNFYYNSSAIRDGIEVYNNTFRSLGISMKLGF